MSIGCFADEYYWVYLFLGSFGCTLKSAKAENMNTEFNTTMPRCHDCQYIARLCNMRLPFLTLNLSFVPYFKPDKSRLGTNKKLIWNTVSLQFAFWAGTEQQVQRASKLHIHKRHYWHYCRLLKLLKLQLKLTCLEDCEDTKCEQKHWLRVDFA